jgi:hypothetical protein
MQAKRKQSKHPLRGTKTSLLTIPPTRLTAQTTRLFLPPRLLYTSSERTDYAMVTTRKKSARTTYASGGRTTRGTGQRNTRRTASTRMEEYTVVAILDDASAMTAHDPELDQRRQSHSGAGHLYKVKWEGEYKSTWEREEDVGVPWLATYHMQKAEQHINKASDAISRLKGIGSLKLRREDSETNSSTREKRKRRDIDDLVRLTKSPESMGHIQKYRAVLAYLAEGFSTVSAADVDPSNMNNPGSGPLTSAHQRNANELLRQTPQPVDKDGTLSSTMPAPSIDTNTELKDDAASSGTSPNFHTKEDNTPNALASAIPRNETG